MINKIFNFLLDNLFLNEIQNKLNIDIQIKLLIKMRMTQFFKAEIS